MLMDKNDKKSIKMAFRTSANLQREFVAACASAGLTQGRVLRRAMEDLIYNEKKKAAKKTA